MTDTLSTIVAHKRDLYAARKAQVALADVEAAARAADAPRGFIKALHAAHADGRYALIAECKKASPSKGLIRADFDPASLARALRTRFEALLPASLGPLARAILAARDAVAARHPTPNDRRRLWERALAQAGPLDPFAALPDADAAVSRVIEGSSTATPQLREIAITSDDPGDLTLNQLNALARCDALVVVGAVVPAIIDRARRDAARLDAVPDPLPAGLTVVLRDEA